ncbi:MAG: 4Fe-4S binding protein [candidate division WOR-3 bacterium]
MEYNKTGSWRNFRPIIDYDKCTKCMICWKFCPEGEAPKIDYEYCKGCGICWEECPAGAIDIEEEED